MNLEYQIDMILAGNIDSALICDNYILSCLNTVHSPPIALILDLISAWILSALNVRDVSVTEDLLVVTLYNRTVRYYSFAWILENVSIRMQCE